MNSFERKDQCCGNCDASDLIAGNAENVVCRAHPATPILYGFQEAPKLVGVPQVPQPMVNAHFPAMRKTNWCREWAPKVEGSA